MTFFSDSSSLYTSTVLLGPSGFSLLMQHSGPTLVFTLLIPHLPTSYLFSLYFHHRLMPWLFFYASCFLFSPDFSGFFDEMLGVPEPGALNHSTLFCLIPWTLFVSRNLILIHLPLTQSLDSLLCDLIAPTRGPAVSLPMPSR